MILRKSTDRLLSYLYFLVCVGQKCNHHVDKKNDSHYEERSVQKINKYYWRIISWLQDVYIHRSHQRPTQMSHHLPPAVDQKDDLKILAMSKHFVNHTNPKLCWKKYLSYLKGNREVKDTDICKEYMWLLTQSPGWDCPNGFLSVISSEGFDRTYHDKDSDISYRETSKQCIDDVDPEQQPHQKIIYASNQNHWKNW